MSVADVHELGPVLEQARARSGGFKPADLGGELHDREPYAVGGEQLYVYRHGAYRPGGEDYLRLRLVEELGSRWKKGRADEVVAWMRAATPRLWAQPPLDVLNCANGLLDVSTGRIASHTPNHLSPVQIAAAYDPSAACPTVDDYLATALADELELLVHQIFAYVMLPDNRLQRAVMLLGPGGTGKSTALNLLRAFLGETNVSAVALHQLEENPFATADLYGRLANVFADLDHRALKSSSIFKSITGGDVIRGERKHRPAFAFKPYVRLLFSANEAPPTADGSDAFFDRWLIVPFERRFRGATAERRDLTAQITTPAELSGLLNHALGALPGIRARGFAHTDATTRASERFRVDADSVAGFIDEHCTTGPGATIAKPELYRAYRAWCELNNRRPLAAQRTTPRIRELFAGQVEEYASRGVDHWRGLELAAPGGDR